jgi:hypothetical protein
MSSAMDPSSPNSAGQVPGAVGNLPGTERLGVIFLEYVNVERKVSGVWTAMATNVPATFERLNVHKRVEMEPWSHKPLYGLWLFPNTPLQDGDRVVRSDGSHWYIRGAPLSAPLSTHIAALAEAATEDGLFATRSAVEPA